MLVHTILVINNSSWTWMAGSTMHCIFITTVELRNMFNGIVILQKVEQEIRDEGTEGEKTKKKKYTEGGGGKSCGVKKFKDETKPSPNACRIEPQIDPALYLKAAVAAKSKLEAQICVQIHSKFNIDQFFVTCM